MSRWCRALRFGNRGFLLMEAILSAVVIATGLVMISRALSHQLGAIRAVEQYDGLLPLAQRKLAEWEMQRLRGGPSGSEPQNGVAAVATALRPEQQWRVTAIRRTDLELSADGEAIFSEIKLWVGPRAEAAGRSMVLSAIWPSEWVPENWY